MQGRAQALEGGGGSSKNPRSSEKVGLHFLVVGPQASTHRSALHFLCLYPGANSNYVVALW